MRRLRAVPHCTSETAWCAFWNSAIGQESIWWREGDVIDKRHSGVSAQIRMLAALRELISALDRRDLHVERASETGIANDARLLRHQAVARIEELQIAGSDAERYDADLVDGIMTDDGGPVPVQKGTDGWPTSGKNR